MIVWIVEARERAPRKRSAYNRARGRDGLTTEDWGTDKGKPFERGGRKATGLPLSQEG